MTIAAPLENVYAVLAHMEAFPQFMPDVESVEVLERKNHHTITQWVAYIDEDTPISWRELDTFDQENRKIQFQLIDGDLEVFEGEWKLEEEKGKTKVSIELTYDFGMPAFEKIIGPILKKKVRDNCLMMLNSIKKKVEGAP